jgi:hypothetical protein
MYGKSGSGFVSAYVRLLHRLALYFCFCAGFYGIFISIRYYVQLLYLFLDNDLILISRSLLMNSMYSGIFPFLFWCVQTSVSGSWTNAANRRRNVTGRSYNSLKEKSYRMHDRGYSSSSIYTRAKFCSCVYSEACQMNRISAYSAQHFSLTWKEHVMMSSSFSSLWNSTIYSQTSC